MRRDTQVLFGCALGIFVAAIEGTVVGTVMPTIVSELGGLDRYGWVFSVYLLSSSVTMPIWGKLSDQFGAKRFFILAIVLFMVGSGLAGTSRSVEALIGWRLIQGFGAGGLVSIALTLLGNHFPPERRGHATGIASSVWGFSAMVGPPIGALVAETIGWRWVFYLNIPIGLAAIALIAYSYRDPERQHEHKLDMGGAATLMAAVSALLIGAQSFKEGRPLMGVPVAGWLALSAVLLVAFVRIERAVAEPIVPLGLFRHPVYLVGNAGGFLMTFCVFTAIAYVPLLLQSGDPDNVLRAGLALIPLSIGWTMGSAGGGRIVARLGGRNVGRLGALSMTIGFLAATRFTPTTSNIAATPVMLLIGLGMGSTSPAFLVTLQNHIGHGRMGVITSGMMFWRNLGGTLGVTLLGILVPGAAAGVLAVTVGVQHTFMAAAAVSASVLVLVQGLPKSILPGDEARPVPPTRPHAVSIPRARPEPRGAHQPGDKEP